MKIEIEIDENMLRYVIGAARLDWASTTHWDPNTLTLRLLDIDDNNERYSLGPVQFAHALTTLASATKKCTATNTLEAELAHHFRDIISGSHDCVTGDVLIQVACFGEVKYG